MKKTFVVVIVGLAILCLCACSRSPNLVKPAPAEGATPVEVEGSCEATLQGTTLEIDGSCNLMNGTNGIIRILSADGSRLAEQKFTKESDDISYSFEVGKDWPEIVYGFISFDTQDAESQPKEVLDAYGKRFENLEGENVIWDLKGVIAVFQSEAVEIAA